MTLCSGEPGIRATAATRQSAVLLHALACHLVLWKIHLCVQNEAIDGCPPPLAYEMTTPPDSSPVDMDQTTHSWSTIASPARRPKRKAVRDPSLEDSQWNKLPKRSKVDDNASYNWHCLSLWKLSANKGTVASDSRKYVYQYHRSFHFHSVWGWDQRGTLMELMRSTKPFCNDSRWTTTKAKSCVGQNDGESRPNQGGRRKCEYGRGCQRRTKGDSEIYSGSFSSTTGHPSR